jgi:hypothetical protein
VQDRLEHALHGLALPDHPLVHHEQRPFRRHVARASDLDDVPEGTPTDLRHSPLKFHVGHLPEPLACGVRLTHRLALSTAESSDSLRFKLDGDSPFWTKALRVTSPTKWATFSYQTGGWSPTKRAAFTYQTGDLPCRPVCGSARAPRAVAVSYQTGGLSPTKRVPLPFPV